MIFYSVRTHSVAARLEKNLNMSNGYTHGFLQTFPHQDPGTALCKKSLDSG
jgi:hypothetical protein